MARRITLPPGVPAWALRRIPPDLRDDAISEAWCAHLEGRNPRARIGYMTRLRAYRQFLPLEDEPTAPSDGWSEIVE